MTSEHTSKRPVVPHIITELNDGGEEAVLFTLIRALGDFEDKVISLTGPGKYGPLIEAAGFDVICSGLSPSLPSLSKIARLTRLVRTSRPDVAQTWTYQVESLGGLVARRAGAATEVLGLHHSTLNRGGTKWTTRWLVGP